MKKIICILLIGLILGSSVGCGNLDTSKEIEENSTPENENTEQLETEENSEDKQNEDFSEYQEYIDIVSNAGLLYREFSKGNYPTENLHLLYVVDNEKLDEFACTFDGYNWILHEAEAVEEDLKEKFDITTEELQTKLEYIENKNAYPKYPNWGSDSPGSWTIIKDVKEKDNTFEIYYEDWLTDADPTTPECDKKLSFEGKLTVTKEGKIISNSDMKHY